MGCHVLLQGSSRPRDQTHISCLAGGFFTTEPPGKPGGEGGGLAIKKQGLVSDGLGTEAGPTWLPQPLRLLGREFSPNLLMTHGAGR